MTVCSNIKVLVDILVDESEVLLGETFLFNVSVILNGFLSKLSSGFRLLGNLKSNAEVLADQTDLEATVVVLA